MVYLYSKNSAKLNLNVEEKPMKKVLAFVLALVLTLTIGSVMAFAENEQPQIVIDGVKDEDYTDTKSLTYDCWIPYDNNGQALFDPVDPERVKNTVWFNWDDESVYIYFQCESKDALYKPAADETELPDFDFGPFFEIAQIYLDTAPSADWNAACIWAGQEGNGDFCNHMACGCREGAEASNYRLMARSNPAFNKWNDYFFTAAGMFMTYEEFCNNYTGRDGCEDLAAAYAATHGNDASAVSFIDYETNVYGFEMKFPRAADEEYFQFNIRTRVNEKDWPDDGPELPYSMSFCPAWWMNSEGLFEIWFEDYEDDVDPAVAAIGRQIAELPSVDLLGREHRDAVNRILAAVDELSEELFLQLTQAERDWIAGAAVKMATFDYIDGLGDINADGKVNANDALIALKAAVNKVQLSDEELARAEVTGDGSVNAKDALEMLQVAVGKRKEFSIVKDLEI